MWWCRVDTVLSVTTVPHPEPGVQVRVAAVDVNWLNPVRPLQPVGVTDPDVVAGSDAAAPEPDPSVRIGVVGSFPVRSCSDAQAAPVPENVTVNDGAASAPVAIRQYQHERDVKLTVSVSWFHPEIAGNAFEEVTAPTLTYSRRTSPAVRGCVPLKAGASVPVTVIRATAAGVPTCETATN